MRAFVCGLRDNRMGFGLEVHYKYVLKGPDKSGRQRFC